MNRRLTLTRPLREEPFFRGMSDAALARVEGFAHHREYEPRQIVYFPDDACDQVYWVTEGRVKITRVSGDGRELTFRHLFPGDLFGEECLTDRPKRDAYAEAVVRTVLCIMRAGNFRSAAREFGEISFALARRLCDRLDEVEHILADTVFNPVRSRVASGILRLHRRAPDRDRGSIRITHQEIANLVGATRETTTVVLHELRNEGILRIANRCITVTDPVALEHVARSA